MTSYGTQRERAVWLFERKEEGASPYYLIWQKKGYEPYSEPRDKDTPEQGKEEKNASFTTRTTTTHSRKEASGSTWWTGRRKTRVLKKS